MSKKDSSKNNNSSNDDSITCITEDDYIYIDEDEDENEAIMNSYLNIIESEQPTISSSNKSSKKSKSSSSSSSSNGTNGTNGMNTTKRIKEEEEESLTTPTKRRKQQQLSFSKINKSIVTKLQWFHNSNPNTKLLEGLKQIQHYPEFLNVFILIQSILKHSQNDHSQNGNNKNNTNNNKNGNMDKNGIDLEEYFKNFFPERKTFSSFRSLSEFLYKYGFDTTGNKQYIKITNQLLIENYSKIISFLEQFYINKIDIPTIILDKLPNKEQFKKTFQLKQVILNDIFNWNDKKGYKEQIKEIVKNFEPTKEVCEVFIDNSKGIYLGNTIPRKDGIKYNVIYGYFCNYPILIEENRCEFYYKGKFKVPTIGKGTNKENVTLTIWENGDKTLELEKLKEEYDIPHENLQNDHLLEKEILELLDGLLLNEENSKLIKKFKMDILELLKDDYWIIFSSVVKLDELTEKENILIEHLLTLYNDLFLEKVYEMFTILCYFFGRDPYIFIYYYLNKINNKINLNHFKNKINNLKIKKEMTSLQLKELLNNCNLLNNELLNILKDSSPLTNKILSKKGKMKDLKSVNLPPFLNIEDPTDLENDLNIKNIFKFDFTCQKLLFDKIKEKILSTLQYEDDTTINSNNQQQQQYKYKIDDISQGHAKMPIQAINEIDFEYFPKLNYLNKNKFGEGISNEMITSIELLKNTEHCNCKKCSINSKCPCLQAQVELRVMDDDYNNNNNIKNSLELQKLRSGSEIYYDENGRLIDLDTKYAIVECNRNCNCKNYNCRNHVVQKGSKIKFTVFKTKNRGWGLKTNERLQKGQFVEEYVGELITELVAEKRGKEYDSQNESYLFDMYHGDEDDYICSEFTIDSKCYGNVTRFINHSCEPNTLPYLVCNEIRDARYGIVAFFCKRDIREGEELTFDYGYNKKDKRIKCTCGSKKCQGWVL
ncbi:hypothetical protein ABK040_001965 [Willaertia magna]